MTASTRRWTVYSILGAGLGGLTGFAVFGGAAYLSFISPISGAIRFLVDWLAFLGLIIGPISPLFLFLFLRDKFTSSSSIAGFLLVRIGMVVTILVPPLLAIAGGFRLFETTGLRKSVSFIVVLNMLLGVMLGIPVGAHVVGYLNPQNSGKSHKFGS